jgi:uncharacterized membrane protein
MGSLFVSFELTSVFDYVGFTAVSIALFCVLLSISAPQSWAVAALSTLIVPIILSLPSLGVDEWRVSLLHVHALGIGSLTVTLLYMTGMLWQLSRVTIGVQASVFRACTRWIGITGVVYVAILVWLVADALFASPDVSVSVALFVYTVSGLALYTFGRTHEAPMLRKVGIGVLALVVARLLIIDVWGMAILGRIATFLGVGLLFIVTALFEKPFHQNDKP